MKENSENSVEKAEDTEAGSLGSLIKRTAGLTVLCFLVAVSLIASLIGCFFPKAYMDMYRSVGAYGIAGVYAEEALDRASHEEGCIDADCDYIMLVTAGVDVTSIAFDDKTNASHAKRLLKFTDAYLAADCHKAHSAAMDEYYAKVYAEKKDVTTLVVVYGYDGYVAGRQTAALGVLADGGKEYADRLSETVAAAKNVVTTPGADDDIYKAFDVVTSCAVYSSGTLETDNEMLYRAFNGWRDSLSDVDATFDVVRLRYKLYRFASAMSKTENAAITKTWTTELVSQAFEDYNNTITKYTTAT